MLPSLAGLYKKYESDGFHIIGLESQGSSAADIVDYAKNAGLTFQLTTNGGLKGSNVSGIPHGFLFGADGKLAADDPEGPDLEKKVKELLKDSAGAMAGPGPYTKLAQLAAQVKTGQGLGAVLKTLRTKKDSKDADEAKEAQMMFEALNGAAQGKLDKALEIKAADPVKAVNALDKLAAQFAGDEIGAKAKTEADTMKKDPAVKKEVEADALWVQVEKINEALKPFQGQRDPKADGFKKLNASALQNIATGCQAIIQRYPGTAGAKKAQELMDQYR